MSRLPQGVTVGLAAVVGLALGACNGARLPLPIGPTLTDPAQTAPATRPSTTVTLSGLAVGHTASGSHPVPSLTLRVQLISHTSGVPTVWRNVTTDEAGRYVLEGAPVGAISIAPVAGFDYYAPCPAGAPIVDSDRRFDVHVISSAALASSGVPASMPHESSIWVSGLVFARRGQDVEPVAEAAVSLWSDGTNPHVASTTLTDARGRYLLCPRIPGTGTDTFGTVVVSAAGYRHTSRRVLLGWDYQGADIQLDRNEEDSR